MRWAICFSAKFLVCLVVMTVGFTALWGYAVTDRLYHCTDSVGLDFLAPGHWVHRPVAVERIVPYRSMSEPNTIKNGWKPDTIKRGWSIAGLWGLWGLCVVTGLVVTVGVAVVPWIPRRRATPNEYLPAKHAS